jgi:AcrR family transcriptional regulator
MSNREYMEDQNTNLVALPRKQTSNREKIIQSAMNHFFTKGYSLTSIDDILKDVKIAKGTFYHYFVSKEAVLESVSDKFADSCFQDIYQQFEKTQSINSTSKLNYLFRLMMEWKQENIESFAMILESMFKESNLSLQINFKKKIQKQILPLLTICLSEGKKSGEFQILDENITAGILIHLIEGLNEHMKEDLLYGNDRNIQEAKETYQRSIEKILGVDTYSIRVIDWASYDSIREKFRQRAKTKAKNNDRIKELIN